MKTKIVSEKTFNELKSLGHTVPRRDDYSQDNRFTVGKEYEVKMNKSVDSLQVRCTQDNPPHLKVI